MRLRAHPGETLIGVVDATFLPKSGTASYGLGRFFSSVHGRSVRGQEASILGVVATESRRAVGINATRTPPRRPGRGSLIDAYLEQIQALLPLVPAAGVRCWVMDGQYAKQKGFAAMADAQAVFITRLRSDANLRYLAAPAGPGPSRKPGRPRRYDGKVPVADPAALDRRFDEVGRLPDRPHIEIWTTVANSPHFGCDLRGVRLRNTQTGAEVLLASTDPDQPADEVVRFYWLRYQIEFVIRDAKQHTGLTDGQAHSAEKIDAHLNLSLTGVNLLRLLAEQRGSTPENVRREAHNEMLAARCIAQLGLHAELDVTDLLLESVLRVGRMVA